jgi:phage/plasmid-like protein (TIGR03299 family)
MHNLEEFGGGRTAFAGRSAAWHGLGTIDPTLILEDALKQAYLADWEVHLEPVYLEGGVLVEGKYATVRTHPTGGHRDALGIVGGRYTPHQNESIFAFGRAILDITEAPVDAAGSLDGGRKVFMSFAVPETVKIGGVDEVRPYLLVTGSHDGSIPTQAKAVLTRTVCENTLGTALRERGAVHKVRHTRGNVLSHHVDQARKSLEVVYSGLSDFQKEAEEFLAREVTAKEFDAIVKAVFPEPDKDASKRAVTIQESKEEEFRRIYASSTQDGIRGTAWGVTQALVEWADHGDIPGYATTEAQLQSAADGALAAWKLASTRKMADVLEMV